MNALVKPYRHIRITESLPSEIVEAAQWIPIVNVRMSHAGRTSVAFPAHVDTGASYCIFHADIARMLHVPFEAGHANYAYGVGTSMKEPVYFFPIGLEVEGRWRVKIQAAFMNNLAMPGLLGTAGFFDHFRVCFDHASRPPKMEITPLDHCDSV